MRLPCRLLLLLLGRRLLSGPAPLPFQRAFVQSPFLCLRFEHVVLEPMEHREQTSGAHSDFGTVKVELDS